MKYLWMALFVVVMAAAPVTEPVPTMMDLENAPVLMVGSALGDINVEALAFDSLRVVVTWKHPVDSLGNEDSTRFNIKASKPLKFNGGGSIGANLWRKRVFRPDHLADTFKVLRPLVGDSVVFTADSIVQFRAGEVSVPGSAAWGYRRTAKVPAMTFDRISVDSF